MNAYVYPTNPTKEVDPLGLCVCDLPDSAAFMNQYLRYDKFDGENVWEEIGGSLNEGYGKDSPGGTQNSCAARISHGLNKSGAPIPPGAPGANKNFGGPNNGKRYVISARQMNAYLRKRYGNPSQTLTNSSQVDTLRASLKPGQVAIASSEGHAAIVASDSYNYQDPYVYGYYGDVWILPSGDCSCN
jgi:hypothetical protein